MALTPVMTPTVISIIDDGKISPFRAENVKNTNASNELKSAAENEATGIFFAPFC